MHAGPEATCHELEVPLLVWTNGRFRAGHGIAWRGQDPRDSFASPRSVEKPRDLIDCYSGTRRTYDQLCRSGPPTAP